MRALDLGGLVVEQPTQVEMIRNTEIGHGILGAD